jgi:subtilisin-like proprotein convertase family protein
MMNRKKLALIPLLISIFFSLNLFSPTFAGLAPGEAAALETTPFQDKSPDEAPDGSFELLDVSAITGGLAPQQLAAPLPAAPNGAVPAYETEPNNTPATANPLAGTSARVRGTTVPAGDLDYFSFVGLAGDRVYAATMTSFSSGGSNSTLDLLDADGVTIIETDVDDGSFAASSSSIAGAVLPANGIYFLLVRSTSNTVGAEMRPYDLYFQLRRGVPTAEVEPNGLADGGQPLPFGGWVSGAINPALDNDVFTLNLNPGDAVFLSLDLDPERDGGTTWNGRLGMGAFSNNILAVNDANEISPNSEAFFLTVKEAGSYFIFVDHPSAQGAAAYTYNLSVTVFPYVPATANCATYTNNSPVAIPSGPGMVTSYLAVPGNPLIADLDVTIVLTHTNMPDLDVVLQSPGGNEVVLFNDIGSSSHQQMNVTLDDEASIPTNLFSIINGLVFQPPNTRRLDWFDHQNAGGLWALKIYDDLAGNDGRLLSWGLTICQPQPICPIGLEPVTIFSSDFEADNGGFSTSGTNIDWDWGAPAALPFNGCNSGGKCWVTNLSGAYSSSSNQDLISPIINLNGVIGPLRMIWAQKHQIENSNWDNAFVQVQLSGGASPTRLWQWIGPTMSNQSVGDPTVTIQQSAGWSLRWADISAYAGQNIQAVFNLSSDSTVNFAGLAIDDFTIAACQAHLFMPIINK